MIFQTRSRACLYRRIIYGISVFVGIIAGIGVTIGVDFVKEKRQSVHDRSNLSFEIILR